MNLDTQIEAILFHKGEPVTKKKLAELLDVTEELIEPALSELDSKLKERGVRLMRKDDEVMLATAPDIGQVIEKIIKEDISKDLGKAGLETLAIVLYKGPINRREIDYIRGVNSNFILRNLLVRGLVEKITSENDQRSYLYRPTFELLSYLGVTKIEDLPEYAQAVNELNGFMKQTEETPKQ